MRSRIAVVAALALAVLLVTSALASGRSHKSRTTRLAVQIETQKLTVVDTGSPGSSPGDMVVEEDKLTRHGASFGTAQVICTAVAGGLVDGRAQCSGTFFLRKGQIETQGVARSVNGSISGAGAVAGGTRRYRGVRGSYSFHTIAGTTRALRFKLIG